MKRTILSPMLGLTVALAAAAVTAGCKDDNSSSRGGGTPELKAHPNPIPPGAGGPGKTMLNWRTGDDASGQVYVSVDGRPEKKVAEGHRGKKEVDWIYPGKTYQFKLYQSESREKVLASITVTTNRTAATVAQPASAQHPQRGAPGATPAGGARRTSPGGAVPSGATSTR